MQTEAIFENIAERISLEIQKANQSIYIAVAWFTNKSIFEEILSKAQKGCSIQIIISNDEINENSPINYRLLEKSNGKVYKIGNGDTELMHNKFCVIDYNTVITGSYNWSYKAESNFENIVINSNDTSLAKQFVNEFNQIKQQYYPEETNETATDFPLEKIIKRLEIIKNFIILEDIEDAQVAVQKLIVYDFNEDIKTIVQAVRNTEFANAIAQIQNFTNNYQQVAIWNDPEIAGIRLEIKLLESQITAFDNEKTELEKVLSDFQHAHTVELGELILEILKLRRLKYKFHKKKDEAEKDYESYNEQFKVEKEKKQFELSEEEKKALKKNFRKATTLCHPDKVAEEEKAEAERVFIELKKAYDENDMLKVNRILTDLETSISFRTHGDTLSEKHKLKEVLNKLKNKLKELETVINTIKENEPYTIISAIADWNTYFKETKSQLENEFTSLQQEIENC